MKQTEEDPARRRSFRRMALFLSLLALGAIVLIVIWLREPPPSVGSTTGKAPTSEETTARDIRHAPERLMAEVAAWAYS
ncbi:conserved hypothetical protein [Burkholderiales bacterium 8X]|nr:conserved hypothetical protein [Burkholderiales bacterium 8X]